MRERTIALAASAPAMVTALRNIASASPDRLARRMADVAFGARLTQAAPTERVQQEGRAVLPTVALTPAELAHMAGRYYSDELDTQYTIELDGDTLRLRVRDRPAIALRPVGANALDAGLGLLHFAGRGFTLDAGRVQGIVFERMP